MTDHTTAAPAPAPDAAELAARAARHQAELEKDRLYLSAQRVAARLGCAVSSVRAIPFDALPFLELGAGARRKRRRYLPADVERYEQALRDQARAVRRAS